MIEIGTKYAIGSDRMNIMVYVKVGKDKQGKDVWKPELFYGSLQNALIGLLNLGVKETGLKDLRTVLAKQEEIYADIKKALDNGLGAEIHL